MAVLSGLYQDILIKHLRSSSNPTRRTNESVMQLALSILEKGLMQPIVVRPIKDHYEIIAGHRRFEAFKILKWHKIMCHIIDVDDKEAFELALIENVQQETMNPIEQGMAFKNYVDSFGWGGESDLARKIGKSQEYISRRIKLLSLPKNLQMEIMRRSINVSVAHELLSLDDSHSVEDMGNYIRDNRLNTKEVRQIVKVVRQGSQLENYIINLNKNSNPVENDNKMLANFNIIEYFGDLRENSNDYKIEYIRSLDIAFKKCILAIRISLKSLDLVIDEMEDKLNGTPGWFIKELLMQHRIRLHDQLDLILRQQSKIKKYYKITN